MHSLHSCTALAILRYLFCPPIWIENYQDVHRITAAETATPHAGMEIGVMISTWVLATTLWQRQPTGELPACQKRNYELAMLSPIKTMA
jgi:hypothetical protein